MCTQIHVAIVPRVLEYMWQTVYYVYYNTRGQVCHVYWRTRGRQSAACTKYTRLTVSRVYCDTRGIVAACISVHAAKCAFSYNRI
jgi:hypothetical protein